MEISFDEIGLHDVVFRIRAAIAFIPDFNLPVIFHGPCDRVKHSVLRREALDVCPVIHPQALFEEVAMCHT